MKKLCLSIACFIVALSSIMAQDAPYKKWENILYIGAGRPIFYIGGYKQPSDKPLTAKIGYGLNYYLNRNFSIGSGVNYYFSDEHVGDAPIGADEDYFEFVDIPFTAQYHCFDGVGTWSFGFGPVLSISTYQGSYYIDADPWDPRNDKAKIKKYNMFLQPTMSYKYKHLLIGVEGDISVNNMIKKYEFLHTKSRNLHNILLLLGFSF